MVAIDSNADPGSGRERTLLPSSVNAESTAGGPPENLKSDVAAKQAFCAWLLAHGYSQAAVCASPADVVAHKNGMAWLFEVKFTRAKTLCFGAATLTEWVAAAENPERFRFVVAYQRQYEWKFDI